MADGIEAFQYFDVDQQQEDINGESFFDNGSNNDNVSATSARSAEIVEVLELSDAESDEIFYSALETTNNSSIYLRTNLRRSMSMNNLPVDDKQIKNEIQNLTTSHNLTKFQSRIPTRLGSNKISGGTIAHTPNLRTMGRARTNLAISKEEQERLKVEEARKFKIRANPVNKRVLRGPLKPQVDTRKAPTQIVPFNLTEVKKKEVEHKQNKVPVFKAQPLPKSLRNLFKVQAAGQPPTRGISPSFSKKSTKPPSPKVEIKTSAETKRMKTGPTLIKPFSFEKRDQMMIRKKEEFINKVFEEKKKAREFHAQPLPKSLRSHNSRATSSTKNYAQEQDVPVAFKENEES